VIVMVDKVGIEVTAKTAGADGPIKKTKKEIQDLCNTVATTDKKVDNLEKDFNKDLPNALKKSEKQAKKTTKQITSLGTQSALTGKSVNGLSSSFKGLGLAIVAAGAAAGVQVFVTAADNFQSLEARVKDATRSTGDFKEIFQDLQDVSLQTGTSLKENVSLFQRLSSASKTLGASNKELIGVTKTLGDLALISGASSEEQANSFRQLAQGLGAGTLRAEEFNSVQEQTPTVIQAIADNIDRFGGSIGKFREEIKKTGTPSIDILRALQKAADDAAERAAAIPKTAAQGFISLSTILGKTASEFDKQIGLTDKFAKSMSDAAKALNDFLKDNDNVTDVINGLSNALQVVGVLLSVTLAGKAIKAARIGFTALSADVVKTTITGQAYGQVITKTTTLTGAAAVATRVFGTALRFAGGPLGLIVTLLGLAAVGMSDFGEKTKRTAAENIALADALKRRAEAAKNAAVLTDAQKLEISAKRAKEAKIQIDALSTALETLIQAGGDPAGEKQLQALIKEQEKLLKVEQARVDQPQVLKEREEALVTEFNRIGELVIANGNLREAQARFSEQFLSDKEKEELALKRQVDSLAGLAIAAGENPEKVAKVRADAIAQSEAAAAEKKKTADANQVIADKKKNDEIAEDEKDAATSRLAAQGQLAGDLLGIVKTFGAENTALGKALALTQIGINTAVALTKGFADLGPIGGAIASGVTIAAGAAAAAQVLASKKGNVFSGGNVVPFQRGGVVSKPTTFPLSGGRTGLMGEAGAEAVLPLKRAANGDLGVQTNVGGSGGGVGGTVININNLSGASVDVRSEQIGNREVINIAVSEARAAVQNDFKRSLQTGYGDFAEGVQSNFNVERR